MNRAYHITPNMLLDTMPGPTIKPTLMDSPVARRLASRRAQHQLQKRRWKRLRNGLATVALSLGAVLLVLI